MTQIKKFKKIHKSPIKSNEKVTFTIMPAEKMTLKQMFREHHANMQFPHEAIASYLVTVY